MPAKFCPICERYYSNAQDCGCPREPDLTDRIQARKLPHHVAPTEDWRDGLKALGGDNEGHRMGAGGAA